MIAFMGALVLIATFGIGVIVGLLWPTAHVASVHRLPAPRVRSRHGHAVGPVRRSKEHAS